MVQIISGSSQPSAAGYREHAAELRDLAASNGDEWFLSLAVKYDRLAEIVEEHDALGLPPTN